MENVQYSKKRVLHRAFITLPTEVFQQKQFRPAGRALTPPMQFAPPSMEGSNVFPVPNSTAPFWRSELHEIDSIRSTDRLPKECDVLIIVGGLSGVSTAYHLLDENPSPPSIVILEAREVCSGATGRNGEYQLVQYIISSPPTEDIRRPSHGEAYIY